MPYIEGVCRAGAHVANTVKVLVWRPCTRCMSFVLMKFSVRKTCIVLLGAVKRQLVRDCLSFVVVVTYHDVAGDFLDRWRLEHIVHGG